MIATIATVMAAATIGPNWIWISPEEIAALPMSGPAWGNLLQKAQASTSIPNISNQNDNTDVYTMAKALVYIRTGVEQYRTEVIQACMAAMETENGGRTLALGRNLIGYVIAAQLVVLPPADDAVFRSWLDGVRREILSGRTLISTQEDRPNNWGTHAGASRIAAAVYLGDTVDLQRAADVWHGWVGNRAVYDGFAFSSPFCWHTSPSGPYHGINPVGGPLDGALPDDMRRSGTCPNGGPAPCENYAREALQGVLASVIMLDRRGHPMFEWEQRAVLRAAEFLDRQGCGWPGDDEWQPWVFNWAYGTSFSAVEGARHGKNVGFTDWTHAGNRGTVCNEDIDGDGLVGVPDLLTLLAGWGTAAPDLDGDGLVAVPDLLILLSAWGACP